VSWTNALIWGTFIVGVLLCVLFIGYMAAEYFVPIQDESRKLMTQSIYNIVKVPLGWGIFCDGVKIGDIYRSKVAALEAAAAGAALAVRDGTGIQINVPGAPESD
jgi:hypothetical protein